MLGGLGRHRVQPHQRIGVDLVEPEDVPAAGFGCVGEVLWQGLEETLGYEFFGWDDGFELGEVLLVEFGCLANNAGVVFETQSEPDITVICQRLILRE